MDNHYYATHMKKDNLYDKVIEHLEEKDKKLTSSVAEELKYCSNRLLQAKTEEDFDAVMEKYKLLDGKLKRAGVMYNTFNTLIDEIKEDYYR